MKNDTDEESFKKINELNESLRLPPTDTNALFERGRLYMILEEWVLATDDFTVLIDINPSVANAYYNRGLCHFQLTKFDKALSDFNHPLLLQRDDPTTLQNRGVAFECFGKFNEALADYIRATELRPGLVNPRLSISNVFYLSEQYPSAIASLTETIADFTESSRAYYQRGLCYYKQKDWSSALLSCQVKIVG